MDEVVETSDPEELEELRSARQQTLNPPQIRPSPTDGRHSPRKRPKLHHVFSNNFLRTPSRSRSSSSGEAVSPRFQPTSGFTSPASLTRASSQKPSSPVATPPKSVTDPSVSPSVAMYHGEDPFASHSQDPLLLGGTESPKFNRRTPERTSPSGRSSSPRLYDEPASPMVVEPDHPITPQRLRSESVDPLLLFTPSRPSIYEETAGLSTNPDLVDDDDIRVSPPKAFNIPSSPLTPPPPENHGRRSLRGSASSRRSQSPPNESEDLAIAQVLATRGRYSLRERNLKQLKPYQHDKAQYQNTLRNLPEAIVKFRSPKRHHTREEDYEVQTQEPLEMDGYEAEADDPWEDRRAHRRSRSRSRSRGPPPEKTLIGPPSLPSTDEEEGRAIDALRKEGRKFLRDQKRREAREKHGRKKARPFPLKDLDENEDHRASRSPSRPTHSRSNSLTPAVIGRRLSQRSPSHRARARTPDSPAPPAVFHTSSPHPLTPVFHQARSVSPPLSFHNNSDADMEMQFNDSFPPSPQVQRNAPGTPIVITDDESVSGSPAPHTVEKSDESEEEPESKEEKKQRRRIHALNRLYPAFMRDRMMKDATAAKLTKRQRSVSSESNGEQPLLPGQTRTRRAEHPRDVRDIKGDSESSTEEKMADARGADWIDEDQERVTSDSELQVVWPHRKRRTRDLSLRRSSDEEVLSDGRIDDERIEAYLQVATVRASGLQERDMIDWMLANTAQVGGTRRPNTRVKSKASRSEGSRRPKISITTGGARRERQSLLSFDKPSNRGRSRDRRRTHSPVVNRNAGTAAPAPRERRKRGPVRQTALVFEEPSPRSPSRSRRQRDTSSHVDDAPLFRVDDGTPSPPPFVNPRSENVDEMPHPEVLRKAARKQKEKERRARMKASGVHIFLAPKGRRIVGQHAKTVTIVADHGFHRALAPIHCLKRNLSNSHTNRKAPVSSNVNLKRRLLPRGHRPHPTPAGAEIGETREESDELENPPDTAERSLVLDFGIPKSRTIEYGAETYTGKGWLGELVNLAEVPDADPPYFSAHGFDLGPNVTAPQFLAIFAKICDRVFDFATGLPDDDNEEQAKDWTGLLRATCRLVTRLLTVGEETEALKAVLETEIRRLTSRMREASLTAKSMDSTTFTICWFAIELPIRAGFRLPACTAGRPSEPNILHEACAVLVQYLLEYGLERGMEPLISSSDRVDGSTAHRAFEAWVGIWHVTDKYKDRDPRTPSAHPLWKMVQTALVARQSAETSDFEASEHVWRAIMSLSAISHSSPRGVPKPSLHVPACWDIVLFALELIRLEPNTEVDEPVSDSSLDGHHRYIKLVVERCCLLWSKWQWPTDGTFKVLNRLSGIFRSRKFANLRHEKAEFPDFLRVNDWTLLSRRIHSESTFVLFLKLVYQTLLVDTSKVKKLISLATPLGSLPWSKEHPPSIHDLSMLFNRFSVIAIAIHIEPQQHARWLQLARGYVKFQEVDATIRNAHIRGWMYLSTVMVQREIKLDEALPWLEEMVSVLIAEHKRQTGPIVVLGIHALVGSVRNVIRMFKSNFEPTEDPPRRYPDPKLLLSLEPILRDSSLVDPNNASAHIVPRLIRSFLSARALAVPEPRRPALPLDQESQDEYGALAFDPDLIAALDQDEEGEYRAKDRTLCKLLDENVSWVLFRQLVQYISFATVESFKANDRLSTDIASLVGCWLGCGDVVIQNTAKTWRDFLHAYISRSELKNRFCQRRMDFLVFSNVLKLDPMTYLDLILQNTFIEILFDSLATWHTTSEDEYIKLLLSIAGPQHPLFKGVSLDPNIKQDEISNIDLLTARLPLIAGILDNLSSCLGEVVQSEDDERYVGYCIKMFAAMKNVHSELNKSAQLVYGSWCLKVHQECQRHPNIMTESRLEQWLKWAKTVNDKVPS
ncbi:Mus7/MMS22 family-domain-containing protein [Mycena vulgaris]|nr:Mus7/MMS22 family-domain-containing protein [Mycena vulgaris]